MAIGDILSKAGVGTLEQIIGYGVGGAVTPVVEWIARPIAYGVNRENPNLELDPQTAALIEVRRAGSGYDGAHEAAGAGLNGERYRHLVESLLTPPGASEVLELSRRNHLTDDQTRTALQRNGLADEWIDAFLRLRKVLLSPQDAAMARQQGFMSEGEARTVSALQGVDNNDADILFEMSGLPPGIGEAMDMLRRSIIDKSTFAQMVREGHTKTKYTDELLQLQFSPLSAAVAAEALIRQRIPQNEAVRIAAENGISEQDFLTWSNMLGRPIGIGQGLTLVRRGDMTHAEFKEVVARSDVRTEYTDFLLKLQRNLPPLFQVNRLLASGAISKEVAAGILTDEGYDKAVVSGIVNAGQKAKTQKSRDLAAGQIDSLYESGLETRQWAIDALLGLGYDADEAEWHLELLDARRLLAAIQSEVNTIHRTYVGHKIDENQARDALAAIAMQPDAMDLLVTTWTNERNANVARLSNAQVGQALKHAGMSRDEAVQRWMQNGYPQDDANWLADIAMKTPHNGVPVAP